MKNRFVKLASVVVVALFSVMIVTTVYAAGKDDPVAKFFRRLFGWPVKTGAEAGKTVGETAVQAGKTVGKTVEDTGKVLIGKENPTKIVTTPVTGAAKTGEKAIVGTGKTVGKSVTESPLYPESKN